MCACDQQWIRAASGFSLCLWVLMRDQTAVCVCVLSLLLAVRCHEGTWEATRCPALWRPPQETRSIAASSGWSPAQQIMMLTHTLPLCETSLCFNDLCFSPVRRCHEGEHGTSASAASRSSPKIEDVILQPLVTCGDHLQQGFITKVQELRPRDLLPSGGPDNTSITLL